MNPARGETPSRDLKQGCNMTLADGITWETSMRIYIWPMVKHSADSAMPFDSGRRSKSRKRNKLGGDCGSQSRVTLTLLSFLLGRYVIRNRVCLQELVSATHLRDKKFALIPRSPCGLHLKPINAKLVSIS